MRPPAVDPPWNIAEGSRLGALDGPVIGLPEAYLVLGGFPANYREGLPVAFVEEAFVFGEPLPEERFFLHCSDAFACFSTVSKGAGERVAKALRASISAGCGRIVGFVGVIGH